MLSCVWCLPSDIRCAYPSSLSRVISCLFMTQIVHWPFLQCQCAAPPWLWRMSPCWSFCPPGRIPPVWSVGSSAAAPWGPSERAETACPAPAVRLPTGTLLRLPPPPPCPPDSASLWRLASPTGSGPHVASSYTHNQIPKQFWPCTTHILTHSDVHKHTHPMVSLTQYAAKNKDVIQILLQEQVVVPGNRFPYPSTTR